MAGIDWTKLGASISDVVMTVVGDHYGLYGRILPADTDLVDDLGSDYVDLAEVVMTMEELFGVRFDPVDSAAVRTLADVVSLVTHELTLQRISSSLQSKPSAG